MEVKWLESEADHSPPASAKITNEWRYISTPSYVNFSALTGINLDQRSRRI